MYYVYELIDSRINLPFYVGKGKGNRAYYHLSENKRMRIENPRKYNKIQKIKSEGYEPSVNIVKYFDDENEAYDYEELLIKKYGRKNIDDGGILTNICESSRPPKLKGRTYQELYGDEWEEQIQKRLKTKKERGNYGGVKHHTEETKKKISEKVAGKNNPRYGVKLTDDIKDKIRKNRKPVCGKDNPNSKIWKLTSPSGEVHIITGGLVKFCESHSISFATMTAAIRYNRKGPRKNGWSIEENI